MKKDLITLVVPCFNEEEAIPHFYKEIKKEEKNIDANIEILFINDGSSDRTLEIIKKLNKEDKMVRYVSFSRNFGKEAAMFAGFENSKGDFVTTMDVDLQDPPELLNKMYKTLKEEDYDCVATKSVSRNGYSFLRKIFTKSFYKIIGKISSIQMVDGARDYRLMKRKMVDALISMKEYNRYSKGLFEFVGFNTKWIEFENQERVAGTTKWDFKKLFKYAMEGIVAFSTTPLIISAFIGILFFIISIVLIVLIICRTLIYGDPVSGWPSLVCIIFFVSGIQLFTAGIIGTYLSKTYLETKNRPIYIIKETEEDNKK